MATLIRKRGDTRPDQFTVTSKRTGAAIDITGYTFLLTVDPSPEPIDAANNLFQLTGVIVDAANGLVEFTPTLVQADNVGDYYYDAQLIDSGGHVETFSSGKYKFRQDITK